MLKGAPLFRWASLVCVIWFAFYVTYSIYTNPPVFGFEYAYYGFLCALGLFAAAGNLREGLRTITLSSSGVSLSVPAWGSVRGTWDDVRRVYCGPYGKSLVFELRTGRKIVVSHLMPGWRAAMPAIRRSLDKERYGAELEKFERASGTGIWGDSAR